MGQILQTDSGLCHFFVMEMVNITFPNGRADRRWVLLQISVEMICGTPNCCFESNCGGHGTCFMFCKKDMCFLRSWLVCTSSDTRASRTADGSLHSDVCIGFCLDFFLQKGGWRAQCLQSSMSLLGMLKTESSIPQEADNKLLGSFFFIIQMFALIQVCFKTFHFGSGFRNAIGNVLAQRYFGGYPSPNTIDGR